jgi:AAT family amino acid transporter
MPKFMDGDKNLQKGLKNRHISLIALGGIIGSSYFLGTGYILNQIGPAACLAYILGGLIMYMTMACLAELSTADPLHGSFISYSAKYISPSWAAGVGWSYWVNWVVYIPSECIAGGIIMHNYMNEIPIYLWAILFGIFITLINLAHVSVFGELEFWLSLIKLFLLISFSVLAIAIFFGLIPKTAHFEPNPEIGLKYLTGDGGFFPNGYLILFMNMVILLSNFQGSEIIGLTAAESHTPLVSIPKALKTISYRIIGLYLLPTFLLALILPWQSANLSGSVFALALEKYGLVSYAHFFNFMIIAGALSCANSGLYAAIRSIHGLALHNMAPKFLKKVNAQGVPYFSVFITMFFIWSLLLLSYFFQSSALYANLLAISGFTGSICWISICICQYIFRKRQEASENPLPMVYKVKWFPYLTILAIILQISCLLIVGLSPSLRMAFYLGVPITLIPILLFKFTKHDKAIID